MKKLHIFMLSLMACLFLGTATSVAAAKDEIDFGALELNKEYHMGGNNYYCGTFTPEKDGFLQVYSNMTTNLRPFIVWKGSARETMTTADNEYSHVQIRLKDSYSYSYEMAVKAGTTYYMCSSTMTGDNVNVTLKMEEKKITCFGASLSEGDEVSPTGTNKVSFSFNRPVVASSAAIIYGDGKEEAVRPVASSAACSISAELQDALLKLGTGNRVKTGDEITVVIRNVKEDADGAGDGEPLAYGDVSIKLTMGEVPTMLLSATLDGVPVTANTKFLTYYAPGTGKLVLNFSKPLDEKAGSALLRFGDSDEADNGGYYLENANKKGTFTFEVKGTQVLIDFSGKRRAVNDMVSSTESKRGADFTVINLEISKITDLNGERAFTTSSKTMGRFNYSFSLDVPEANVSSEFTPMSGASIKNVDNIEIWITDYATLSFQGVSFSYDQKENGIEVTPDADGNVDIIKDVVVDMNDIQVEPDEDDEEEGAYILTVPVPEEVKNMKNVTVSLYKVTCADGKDYTDIVAAKYNVVTDGIESVTTDANKSMKVYNLNGQLVREGKSLRGLKGIYVVDGKKMVLN